MSARRADAAAPWFVLPYGAAKGLKGTLKATCRILAFGAWRHSAEGVVTRFTGITFQSTCMNALSVPTRHRFRHWCAILRGYVDEKMLRIEAHRGHETPEWSPERCTAAKQG